MYTHIHTDTILCSITKERHGLNKCLMNKFYKVCSLPVQCTQRHHSLWWPEQTQRDPNLTPFNNLTLWASKKYSFTHRPSIIVITVCNWPRITPQSPTNIRLIAGIDKYQFTGSQNKKCQAAWSSRSYKWK